MSPAEIIQALTGIIILGMGWWLRDLHTRVKGLEGQVGQVERIEALIEQHVVREEQQTWPRMDHATKLMTEGLTEVKIAVVKLHERFDHVEGMARDAKDHIEKHDDEADGWKHRIVQTETRMDRVESDVDKLKNGKNHA